MAFTNGNDVNFLQATNTAIVGAGGGSDTYVLDSNLLTAGQKLTLSDTQGANILQLVGGLTITSSQIASNALKLTLSNGAEITILGADAFTYVTGGAIPSGAGGLSQNYADFVVDSLGGVVPPAGQIVNGDPNLTVNVGGGTGLNPPIQFVLTVSVNDVTEGQGNLAFRLELDQAPTSDLTVTVFTGAAGDTATAGLDYTPVSRQITFAAGQTVQFVDVIVNDDSIVEGPETVTLVVNAASNITVQGDLVAVIYSDDLGNRAPVAYDQTTVGNEGSPIPGRVAGTDLDGDTLVYSIATPAGNGTVNIVASTGDFVYTPNVGFSGSDSFDYQVSDGNGGTDTATVSITVNDVANVLTPGIDNVLLSGTVGQAVIGNDQTYNPGDSIQGGAGVDTVQLGLAPAAPVVLGSATVNGIEIFRINANPVNAADSVTLLMSSVDDDLQRVEIFRSLGHNFTIADLQNLPLIRIDDVGANITVDVDNQVVLGPNDTLPIEVLEFGSNSSSSFGRSVLNLDEGIEHIHLTDRAQASSFASDISAINGGYNTIMIDGGATGVDLTVQEVAGGENGGFLSAAGTGITVDSRAFLGDLVADIDGAGSGTVMTGVGRDELTAHEDVSGTVNSGAGNDIVLLDSANLLGGSIQGEAGDDTITVQGSVNFSGSIDAGADNDTVLVTGALSGGSTIMGGTGSDVISVQGGVSGSVQGNDGADRIYVANGIGGSVDGGADDDILVQSTSGAAGRVTGSMLGGVGNGNDYIQNNGILGNNAFSFDAGLLDGGSGDDAIYQTGNMEEGSRLLGGDGNDFISVAGALVEGDTGLFDGQSAAFIGGGADNDTIRVYAVLDGDVDAGTGNDIVEMYGDQREGSIDLGDGDDHVLFDDYADFLGDGAGGAGDGSIDGGLGANVMTLRISVGGPENLEMEVVSDGTPPFGVIIDGTDITRIQTLNIEAIDFDSSPDFESDQTFDVNLQAFDTTLDTINVLERDDSMTVNLGGYDSEVINVDSDGDAGVDVTLNVSTGTYGAAEAGNSGAIHDLRDGNETLNVNLNGASAYEVAINDAAGINVTNLASNGSGARTVMLDSADQDNNGGTAGEGNSLIITGTNTSRLTVTGIYQETINAAAFAGPVSLTIANDGADPANDNESLTITTGAGDDVVNMVADILDLQDGVIDLGAGTDRLIINESTRRLSLVDEDQIFKQVRGVEILELRGDDATNDVPTPTPLEITIEDDSREAGIRTIDVTNDGPVAGNVDLDVDADYMDTSLTDLMLTVNVMSGIVNIDNGADVDNTVNLYANKGNSSGGPAVAGAGVTFAETGSGDVDVNVHVSAIDTLISASTLAGPKTADAAVVGNVVMDVVSGEIDSLTLVDSAPGENGKITLTWADNWANGDVGDGPFTIDASGIANNDFTVLGVPITTTGGMLLIAAAEDDLGLNILGTQNDDVIWGGQLSDTINGNDGDDEIHADVMGVVAPGVQMVKSVDFDENDVVEAGDSYSVTLGGQTYTWTATADGQTVGMAVSALAGLIFADQSAVDGDPDTDVAVGVNTTTGTITVKGIDVDDNFGYALGEDINFEGDATNRPTATVTVQDEGYDIGDVVSIDIDGTVYSATVTSPSPDDVNELALALAAEVNGGTQMTASVAGNVITLTGNTPDTAYEIIPSWTNDPPTTPATNKTATITYTGLGAGEFAAVTFSGGITISAATVLALATAIDANGTVGSQWNAFAVGDVLTLTAVVAGAAAPANDFAGASLIGDGSAGWLTVAGLDAVVRTDNTDPVLGARQVSFDMNDMFYDGGDEIVVTIDGVSYSYVLPAGPLPEDDVNHPGAVAAAAVATAAVTPGEFVPDLPAGFIVESAGSVVTITAPVGSAPSWDVSINDVLPVTSQPEIITVDYTVANEPLLVTGGAIPDVATTAYNYPVAGVAGPVATLSVTLNDISHTFAADLDIYLTGPNGQSVMLMSDLGGGGNLVGFDLTFEDGGAVFALASGTYAPSDDDSVSVEAFDAGFATSFAAAFAGIDPNGIWTLTVVDDLGGDFGSFGSFSLAINGQELWLPPVTEASLTIGSTTYSAATLAALEAAIDADMGVHGYDASLAGSVITLTGPATGEEPVDSVDTASISGAFETDGGVVNVSEWPGPYAPATPYEVTIDFLGYDVGETLVVTLAGSRTYEGTGVNATVAMAALAAAINLEFGTHGWTADDTLGINAFTLTGPADGSAPAIGFFSAALVADGVAAVAEVQESWENADNTDPTLKVVSGAENSDSVDTTVTAAEAAAVATGFGNDVVNGGNGNDTIFGYEGNDLLNGDNGNDLLYGGMGNDQLNGGSDNDQLDGGDGADQLNGDSGNDQLYGGKGADQLNGGSGNDWLWGGDDNDVLNGGNDDDYLHGGAGRDILTGGAGNDVFAFDVGDSQGQVGVADQVVDFTNGQDRIDLSSLAGASGVPGTWNAAVDFVGTVSDTTNLIAALNNGGPSVGRTVYDSNAQLLYIDVDGNGVITVANDMTIELTGVATMSVADFA